MFKHQKILDRIVEIEEFFKSISLEKVSDFPENWDLDSHIRFEPIQNNYIVNYKGEDRVLLNVNIYITSGLNFILSGKMGVSVFETIPTDYDFKTKYEESEFFKDQLRDWKINNLLNYENT